MKYFLFTLIALSFICCQSKKEDKAIFIDLSDVEYKAFNKSDFNIADTIRLQETEKSQLRKIHKISFDDQFIFILDKSLQKVFQFDRNGKFENRYAPLGDAPQQADYINDFSLDKKNNIIYILDVNNRKILQFDYDGQFVDSKRLAFEAYDIDLIKSNRILARGSFYDEKGFNLRLLDYKNNKVLKKYCEFPKDIFPVDFGFVTGGTNYQNGFYLYNDPISYDLSSFSLNDQSITQKYEIHFGENRWPDNKRFNHKDFLNQLGSNEFNYITPYFFENENWLFLKYNQANSNKIVDFKYLYYDKSKKYAQVYSLGKEKTEFLKNTIYAGKDYFYSFKKEGLDKIDKKETQLEKNPYLIKYKINL